MAGVKKHMKFSILVFSLVFSVQLLACSKVQDFEEFLSLYRADRDFQFDHVIEPFEVVVAKGEYDGKSWNETSSLTLEEIKENEFGLYAQPKIIDEYNYVEIIEDEGEGVFSVTIGPENSSSVVIFYFKLIDNCWRAFRFRDIWTIHAS